MYFLRVSQITIYTVGFLENPKLAESSCRHASVSLVASAGRVTREGRLLLNLKPAARRAWSW